METINVSEVKSHLSEYLSRAAAGERFVILRRERPVAALIGVNEWERLQRTNRTARQLALALGQQAELLQRIEAGEVHPVMAAFGLWRDEDDLASLAEEIRKNRREQPDRDLSL